MREVSVSSMFPQIPPFTIKSDLFLLPSSNESARGLPQRNVDEPKKKAESKKRARREPWLRENENFRDLIKDAPGTPRQIEKKSKPRYLQNGKRKRGGVLPRVCDFDKKERNKRQK